VPSSQSEGWRRATLGEPDSPSRGGERNGPRSAKASKVCGEQAKPIRSREKEEENSHAEPRRVKFVESGPSRVEAGSLIDSGWWASKPEQRLASRVLPVEGA
jgi:hypothetical protein